MRKGTSRQRGGPSPETSMIEPLKDASQTSLLENIRPRSSFGQEAIKTKRIAVEEVPPSVIKVPMLKQKRGSVKLIKAPGAPKRFRPAFILFSAEKHKEIRAHLMKQSPSPERLHSSNIAKLVAQAWKNLAADERSAWEELAREDKFRYEIEKTLYKGPWRIEKTQKTKDVNTPKRPVSAYLAFANSRRADVRRQMQKKVSNTELSRELAKMWKESPDEVRHSYIAEAKQKRQKYLAAMIEWKKKVKNENAHDNEEAALRLQEEEFSLNAEALDDCIIDMFIEPVHINEEEHVSNMAANSNTLGPDSKMNAVVVNSQPYSYQPDTRNFLKAADQSQPSDHLVGPSMPSSQAQHDTANASYLDRQLPYKLPPSCTTLSHNPVTLLSLTNNWNMRHATNTIAARSGLHHLVALREQTYSNSGHWMSLGLQARELSNDTINSGLPGSETNLPLGGYHSNGNLTNLVQQRLLMDSKQITTPNVGRQHEQRPTMFANMNPSGIHRIATNVNINAHHVDHRDPASALPRECHSRYLAFGDYLQPPAGSLDNANSEEKMLEAWSQLEAMLDDDQKDSSF